MLLWWLSMKLGSDCIAEKGRKTLPPAVLKHTVMICLCVLWDTAYKTSSHKNFARNCCEVWSTFCDPSTNTFRRNSLWLKMKGENTNFFFCLFFTIWTLIYFPFLTDFLLDLKFISMLQLSEYFLMLQSQVTGVCRRVKASVPSENGLGIHHLEEAREFVKFWRQKNKRWGTKSEAVAAKMSCWALESCRTSAPVISSNRKETQVCLKGVDAILFVLGEVVLNKITVLKAKVLF